MGGRVGHRKSQLTRDSCSLSLPDTRVPCDNRKGAASAMLVPWGLREEGRGMEDTTSTQTLTPISHTTLFASPRTDRGVGSGSSVSCHSPGPPSGAGVSNKGSFRLASSRRMFTRRSDEKLSPNAVL